MHTEGPGYGKKTENHGKWEIHTLGREIWQGKLKKRQWWHPFNPSTWEAEAGRF